MGQVRPLIGRDDAEQLAAHIMKDQLSAREVERLIKAGRKNRKNQSKLLKICRY